MALKLINREEVTENGEVFIIETYQSDITGKETVVKHPKPSEVVPEPVDPEPTQLDRIEAKLQVNEDLQNFYDEIVKEVGL